MDRVVAGGNYGWRCFEGTRQYNSSCGPNAASSLPPVAEYGRSSGQSITGGYVYRGASIPALAGRYVFGDFVTGRIWHIARDTPPTLDVTQAPSLATGLSIASFAEAVDGELYVVHYGGTLHRLRAGATGGGTVPMQLSATGCVQPGDATKPASGLVPYAPNAPFWSDGADKDRYLALPNGATIAVAADGDFDLPNGSVLIKGFRLAGKLVETRLFMRHTDGEWAGYTYEWNAQGSDATRVIGGKTVSVNGQTWAFPSEAQCLACHTSAAGRSLGLEIAQLNGNLLYPQTGRVANQIVTLNSVQMFSPPVTTAPFPVRSKSSAMLGMVISLPLNHRRRSSGRRSPSAHPHPRPSSRSRPESPFGPLARLDPIRPSPPAPSSPSLPSPCPPYCPPDRHSQSAE